MGREAVGGGLKTIDAILRTGLYPATGERSSPSSPTLEQVLTAPTKRILITHCIGGSQPESFVSSPEEAEVRRELGLSRELSNVLLGLSNLTGENPISLARNEIIPRSREDEEGYLRWVNMREMEPAMLNGLVVWDKLGQFVYFRSGLIGFTLSHDLITPESRVDYLEGVIAPHYRRIAESLRSEIGFKDSDITRLLLLENHAALFRGLDIVDREIGEILNELRGPDYMTHRGRVLYKLLERRGSGVKKIDYLYDEEKRVLSQQFPIDVPKIEVRPGHQYNSGNPERQKVITFARRLGIFCNPFFQGALAAKKELIGR